MALICLAESEESLSLSGTTFVPSCIAKLTRTVKEFWAAEWKRELYIPPPYGTTSEPSIFGISGDAATLFLEVSPARMFHLREINKVWKASEAGFFSKSYDLLKRCSPHSSFSKTYPVLNLEAENEYARNWPKNGMIVAGRLFPLLDWEHPIAEKDGFLLAKSEEFLKSSLLERKTLSDSLCQQCNSGNGENVRWNHENGQESGNHSAKRDTGFPFEIRHSGWQDEPHVARVANGVPFRMERVKALGNGVVPQQVKKAFEILIGIQSFPTV
jgi:hypothetical protein